MPIRFRLISHINSQMHWTERAKLMHRWRYYFRPPWLMVIHIVEIFVLFTLLFEFIIPNVKDTFLIRAMFADNLCFNLDLNLPISRITDVADFIQSFEENLVDFVYGSFMYIYFVNVVKPYDYLVTWTNGTTVSSPEITLNTEFFRHISKLRVETSLYYVIPRSAYKGCTKWDVATEITKSEGSYTFSAAPCISRTVCPADFMKNVSFNSLNIEQVEEIQSLHLQKQLQSLRKYNSEKQRPPRSLKSPKTIQTNLNKNKKRNNPKSSRFKGKRSIHTTIPEPITTNFKLSSFNERKFKPNDLTPLLPNEKLPQAALLENLSYCLLFLSITGTFVLALSLFHRWMLHIKWRSTDPMYRDLEVYEQIHHSLGFWHPLHFLMDIVLIATSGVLLHESTVMTQFVSLKAMQMFAVGFFLTICISTRWFIFWPNIYQVVLIIRVAFTRLLSTFIGLLPIICGFMMIAVFLFGQVSDISKNYYRYLQLFFGLVFGDDTYAIFSYFSDGTLVYDLLSLFFTMFIALLAGYIFFPAFTATISFMRSREVIVIQENDKPKED